VAIATNELAIAAKPIPRRNQKANRLSLTDGNFISRLLMKTKTHKAIA